MQGNGSEQPANGKEASGDGAQPSGSAADANGNGGKRRKRSALWDQIAQERVATPRKRADKPDKADAEPRARAVEPPQPVGVPDEPVVKLAGDLELHRAAVPAPRDKVSRDTPGTPRGKKPRSTRRTTRTKASGEVRELRATPPTPRSDAEPLIELDPIPIPRENGAEARSSRRETTSRRARTPKPTRDRPRTGRAQLNGLVALVPKLGRFGGGGRRGSGDLPFGVAPPPGKPRLRKFRLLAILTGLGALGLVSFVFGVLMSVASDIPLLENYSQFQHEAKNSALYDDQGHLIGILRPAAGAVVVPHLGYVSPWMRKAVVAIEDKRFWSEPGIDIQGILRAVVSDVTGGATQGASTITEQFVKQALQEQNNRTIFEKLREAALAFHLSHQWHKDRILREYLNSVYFGNGAYGVESAAREYFGNSSNMGYDPNASADGTTGGCGNTASSYCASKLDIGQSALLAGMIAAPGLFNPLASPDAARGRRDVVLRDMLNQGTITRQQFESARAEPLPTAADIEQPQEPPAAPYFTSWVEPQITRALVQEGVPVKVAQYRADYGGLKIKTTLDLSLQRAADQAVEQVLPYGSGQPAASLVAIDNHTGEVRAMVGGPIVNGREDFQQYPFNLATQGARQPGSAFKPFTLAVALEDGIGPDSVWTSAPQNFVVPNSGGKEIFRVRNFGNQYSGSISLQGATDVSDNSVFSQVGIKVGTQRVANMAKNMGIRSPVSANDAMILGAMKQGPTLLDMAHAYETFATGGVRVYNSVLGSPDEGPIGIHSIDCTSPCTGLPARTVNRPQTHRVLPASIAQEEQTMLEGPVQSGTATKAAISGVLVAGKTGTTSNYGDAWFVGWTPQLTVAVWVGFPNKLIPMSTLYNGQPVEGGTYPAIIWHSFMVQALQILAQEAQGKNGQSTSTLTTAAPSTSIGAGPTSTTATTPTTQATTTTAGGNTGGTHNNGTGGGNAGAGTGGNVGGGTGGGTGNAGSGTGGGTGGTTGGAGLGGGG